MRRAAGSPHPLEALFNAWTSWYKCSMELQSDEVVFNTREAELTGWQSVSVGQVADKIAELQRRKDGLVDSSFEPHPLVGQTGVRYGQFQRALDMGMVVDQLIEYLPPVEDTDEFLRGLTQD